MRQWDPFDTPDEDLHEKVQKVIDEKIKPGIQSDGGDIELVGIEDGWCIVRLHGACVGCPSSQKTLYKGVENLIRAEVPEIVGVDKADD